jgi:hypothetical protein
MRTVNFIFFLFLLSGPLHAQEVDEIVDKYIQFTGGKKEWNKVKTLVTSGEYDYGGISFPFTTYAKAPDRYKFIVPANGKYFAQGYDGEKGWKIDAFKNEATPVTLKGAEARKMLNEADVELVSPFIDYKKKGHQVVLEGVDSVKGQSCYKIKLIRKSGETEYYFFDEKTSSLLKKTSISKNSELGGAEIETFYSDYRSVSGIKIPFKSVSESNGQMILTVSITKAAVGAKLTDDDFTYEHGL